MANLGYQCEIEGPVPQGLDTNSLNCSVCFGIFRSPHLMGCCGQHMCEGCVQKIAAGPNCCPMCGRSFMSMLDLGFQRRLLELGVSCVFREEGCRWTGKLRDVDSHVAEDCLYVCVVCLWGCEEKVIKCKLEEHKLSLCPKRPWYTCFQDADLRRLAEKVEALSDKKQALSKEVNGLKEKLDQVEQDKQTLSSELSELRTTYSTDIQDLRSTIVSLKIQLDEMKSPVEHSLSSSSVASSTAASKPIVDSPAAASPTADPLVPIAPTLFIVTEVKRRTKQQTVWYSPYFLSHSQGYQLQLRVDCGGVLEGAGSYISVYVYLTKGEHDKNLKWPFEGSVKVRLLDPADSLHHEKIVEFPKGTSQEIVGCVKEGQRAKRGQGYAQFLPLVDLKPYLSENTLNFEVDVTSVKKGVFAGLSIFRR